MQNRVKDLFSQTIMQLLVAGVIAVIACILAKIAELQAYQILIVVLAAICLTLWGINQFAFIRERYKKRLTKFSEKELYEAIRSWVDKPYFKVQPNKADSASFILNV